MNQIELGKRIRKLRKEKNLSMEQIGGDKFTKGYISQIELGRVKPSFGVLEHIAKMLDTDIEELIIISNNNDTSKMILDIEN